ncbi:MAG: hypothetical protein KDI74_02770 [Gammaproteobacteria bacterium]|nr:hypothetical protein [Gammaproteobacteria bacterium]
MKRTVNKTTRMGCQPILNIAMVWLLVRTLVLLIATPGQLMAENWDASDNPARLADRLEIRINNLPQNGQSRYIPWAGPCWETFRDSINTRWAGTSSDSAATKYGVAFGVSGVADAVSENYGIDRYKSSRTNCTQNSECDSSLGEACAKRTAQSAGVCIPTWWGICHAWAPVSIDLPEPKIPVEYNAVRFQVSDIKALLSVSYTRASARIAGERCDEDAPALDDHGRPESSECRSTNAGTWHVILSNIVGLDGKSFIMDQRRDGRRSSYPIWRYRTTRLEQVTLQDAMRLVADDLPGTAARYLFNATAVSFYHVETAVDYIVPSPPGRDGFLGGVIDEFTRTTTLDYILEVDADDRIIGGEYIGTSKTSHPDFLWKATGRGNADAAGGRIRADDVMHVYALSTGQAQQATPWWIAVLLALPLLGWWCRRR